MLWITDRLAIPEEELEKRFSRAGGPGGQHVNKVATRVELRFDLTRTRSLAPEVVVRLRRLAGRRVTQAGVLRIVCGRHREQARNLEEARGRLAGLVRAALAAPRPRRPTRPPPAARERRLAAKRRRSEIKRRRRPPAEE